MARAADETLFGREIAGKYVIESFVGGGAMGSVYRARQRDIEKVVAIKVLHRELVTEPLFAQRFKREAKAASRLDHPNSMRVYDFGEEPDGLCYIVMELLEGRSLFRLIRDEAPLESPRVVEFLRQTLAALAVAHDMGVVHRDLKPENIVILPLIDDEGQGTEVVKVCDFGMAKVASRLDTEEKLSEKLTSHGVVVGTPEYMSPEQGRGEALDGRSDLYSVGIILYQLITGRLPFQAETAVGVLLKHLIEEPIAPSAINPGVDATLEAVAMKAMQKRPDDRYASAREMRAALGTTSGGVRGAMSQRMPPAGDSGRMHAAMRQRLGEAATVQVQSPLSTRLESTVQTAPRSLRQARDLLSEPPPPPKRSLLLPILLVLVPGGIAVAAWTGRLPGIAAFTGSDSTSGAHVDAVTAPGPSVSAAPSASGAPAPSAAPSASVAEAVPSGVPAQASASASQAMPLPPVPGASGRVLGAPAASHLTWPDTVPVPPAAQTPPVVAPPAAPNPGAAESGRGGQVMVGGISAERVNGPDVLAVLPVDRFSRCYRDGLHAGALPTVAAATLHVDLDADGSITAARFEGLESLRQVGQCIVDASTGRRVRNAEAGASADIQLSFKANP